MPVPSLLVALGAADAALGEVCFVRAENTGAMNLHAVRLLANHGRRTRQVAMVRGGDSSCVELRPGRWSLKARSVRPHEPSASDPNECRSIRLDVQVSSGSVRNVSVSRRAHESTYVCGWNLE